MRSNQPGKALLGYWTMAETLVYSCCLSPSMRRQVGKIWTQLGAIQSEICSKLGTADLRADGLGSKDERGSKEVHACLCSLPDFTACCLCRDRCRSSIICSCSATLDSASKEER